MFELHNAKKKSREAKLMAKLHVVVLNEWERVKTKGTFFSFLLSSLTVRS